MTDIYWPIPIPESRYRARRMTFKPSDFGLNSPFYHLSTPPSSTSRPPSPSHKHVLSESRYRCGVCGCCFHNHELPSYVAHVKLHARSRGSSPYQLTTSED